MEPLTVRRQGDPAHGLVPGWPLAVFRIAFGLLYLDMAFQKAPWRGYGWLEAFIRKEIDHPTFPWMAAFLRDVVLAHFGLFGALTFVTEATLGVALLLGLFTRVAAVIGMLWQINIALQAFNVPGEWYWIWPLLVLPQFTFAAAGAGRVLGLDAILRRRRSAGRTGGAFDGFVRLAT
jgi:uncharacterized membrane protein YphA (DoxX/SURF4 family)